MPRLNNSSQTFSQRVAHLATSESYAALRDIKHGVEREGLRINADGRLSQLPHPVSLGSALTHDSITTDFSESLMEFITPPEKSRDVTLAQLADIHKFVMSNTDEEYLWPMSMPCYVRTADEIPIAQYGSSHVGKMKTLYRVGLKNRYGSMMQAISGVHFNFSLPDTFWQYWLNTQDIEATQDNVSAAYFSLIRNYRRLCWMIPYLYGASPALCGSFLQGRDTGLPFEKLGKGTLYLPYATSLRMSDLGYTNSAQSTLQICYNRLDTYINSLRQAISTPSEEYAKFDGRDAQGHRQQLNANILQIENELYSPIRPKQVAKSLEKPTDALAARGVSYIEVRALDVNPFSALGIEAQQFDFLDVFLLHCAISDSPEFDTETYQLTEHNLNAVVLEGRRPGLTLSTPTGEVDMLEWAKASFEEFKAVAKQLDSANDTTRYSDAVANEWKKFEDPELTFSGRWLSILKAGKDNGEFGLELAHHYRNELTQSSYQLKDAQAFASDAEVSLANQAEIESQSQGAFDDFLEDYFRP